MKKYSKISKMTPLYVYFEQIHAFIYVYLRFKLYSQKHGVHVYLSIKEYILNLWIFLEAHNMPNSVLFVDNLTVLNSSKYKQCVYMAKQNII